jgi:hypothetical protein
VPAESADTASSLEDYLDLLEVLSGLGVEFVVIGGCAVGAYARLLGETVFSGDLDLFVTQRALEAVVADGAAIGVRIEKLPSPRSIPVALLGWRGREVNLITATDGLPPPDVEARAAREFQVGGGRDLTVLIADPFDLLRNKRAVNRPKDQSHIGLLRRFIDEEVVHAFVEHQEPRARIGPAERLLEVLGVQTLEETLALRLTPLAKYAADFRFLAHRAPTLSILQELLSRAPGDEVRATIERIARSRGFVT